MERSSERKFGNERPVALVTGSASFLGQAICRKLARMGFDLALHYWRSSRKTLLLSRELGSLSSQTLLFQADLRMPSRAMRTIQEVLRKIPRLDLLVNNASLFYPTPLARSRPEQWEELLSINLVSPYFLCRAAFPLLKKTSGAVVNMTDIYGESPRLKDHAAYCISKAGLLSATKILAMELGPFVRVNAVSPGAISIPQYYDSKRRKALIEKSALKRQGRPEDVAEAVHFLATQPFLTGQVLKVDGGRSDS